MARTKAYLIQWSCSTDMEQVIVANSKAEALAIWDGYDRPAWGKDPRILHDYAHPGDRIRGPKITVEKDYTAALKEES